MIRNIGTLDKTVRILLAIVVAILYLGDFISGVAVLILGIFAVLLLLTGIIGICPAYFPLGINTRKKAGQ